MKRAAQILLIGTLIAFCWLAMQAVHEMGHVLVARLTGGEVLKVALHRGHLQMGLIPRS
jgi:membrane-associated protease RseP (regulator of RpoE activity)